MCFNKLIKSQNSTYFSILEMSPLYLLLLHLGFYEILVDLRSYLGDGGDCEFIGILPLALCLFCVSCPELHQWSCSDSEWLQDWAEWKSWVRPGNHWIAATGAVYIADSGDSGDGEESCPGVDIFDNQTAGLPKSQGWLGWCVEFVVSPL